LNNEVLLWRQDVRPGWPHTYSLWGLCSLLFGILQMLTVMHKGYVEVSVSPGTEICIWNGQYFVKGVYMLVYGMKLWWTLRKGGHSYVLAARNCVYERLCFSMSRVIHSGTSVSEQVTSHGIVITHQLAGSSQLVLAAFWLMTHNQTAALKQAFARCVALLLSREWEV